MADSRVLLLTGVLLLAACGDRTAGSNPTVPGSPGTGNSREAAAPRASDSQPGGSAGNKGIMPQPGSSGGDVVPGTTGSGTSEPGGRSQPVQPGIGTTGGLGGSATTGNPAVGAQTQGTAPAGTTNRTSSGSMVGR